MSTQWTTPSSRLMRWRVRDWVSCFLASRIPLDDGPAGGNFRNMISEYNMNDGNSNGGRSQYRHTRRKSRRRKERRIINGDGDNNNHDDGGGLKPTPSSGKGEETSNRGEGDETTTEERELLVDGTRRRCPDDDHLQEDYIVFCFGENGAFEVVKDCRHRSRAHSSISSNGGTTAATTRDDRIKGNLEEVLVKTRRSSSSASKPTVNRKLNYGNQENGNRDESAAAGRGRWEEKRPLSTNQQDIVGSSVKPEGEENYSSSTRERRHPLGEIDRNQLGAAAESSSSRDHSHSSSSDSFSFPVLQWEEMVGSPVQMPKPEDFHLRKHRMNCARFQCCRFHRNSID